MERNSYFRKNEIWKRYRYCICAILLTLFSFYFYASIVSSVFGLVLLFMQAIIFYCILNIFSIHTTGTILISLISTFIIFELMELLNVMIPDFVFLKRLSASPFIITIWYILSACFTMFMYFVWQINSSSLNHKKTCFHLILCVLIGILMCAFKIDNMETYQVNSNIFLFIFLITHFIFSYYIYHFSNKFLIIGNILIAFYFASTQLYMTYFYTEEISNTGWAISYVLFLTKEYFIVHGSIAFIVLLFAFITKRLYQKNIYKTVQ